MLTHEGCRPSHRIGVPNGNLVPQEPGLFDPSDIRCISNIRCLPSEDIGQSSIVPVIDVSDLAHADVVGMIWLSRMTICASRLVSSDLDRVSDWSGLVAISQTSSASLAKPLLFSSILCQVSESWLWVLHLVSREFRVCILLGLLRRVLKEVSRQGIKTNSRF